MKFLSQFMRSIGVIVIVLFCAASIFLSIIARQFPELKQYFSYAEFFEHRFYDFRSRNMLNEKDRNDNMVLVKVDDESLQKLGSWPVDRLHWATMLKNLKNYGAKIVAFDVIFPEEVKSCGESSPDDVFAEAITDFQDKEGNKVILAYTTRAENEWGESFDELPEKLYDIMIDSHQSEGSNLDKRYVIKHTWPIQKLIDAGADLGYINMLEDSDGVFRHYQVVANLDTLYFPSLALRAYELWSDKSHKLEINQHNTAEMSVGEEKKLFINNRGETKVRWFGWHGNFPEVSLHEIVNGDPSDQKLHDMLNGKIIFIGSTAIGAHDLRNTPVDAKMPGVFVHMNMIHMFMHQFIYQSLDDSVVYTFYIMGVGLLILLVVMYFNRAILDLVTVILISAAALFIDYKFFLPQGYELKLFFTIFAFISTYSWLTFLNFNQASAEKKQIKGAFSRYVAPAIVNDMLDNPDKLKVGGEKRDITCMFSDVRDFTSISERLSATELALALNRYMGEMTDIVFATNGTLDKYIGDAIVAFWGAPIDIGDHVNQAVDAAVKMLEALPAINEEFKQKNLPEFKIGLGLNSGECSVGNMGSDQIFAYTALGDNMNLGARLESLCKHYGAQILISEFTYDRLDHDRFTCRLIDKVRVKGKTEPVGVYEVLFSYHPFMIDKQSLELFKQGYQLYLDAKFTEALQIFDQILEKHPTDKSSLRLKASCEHWIENPPKEGEDHTITTMTTK